MLPVAVIAPAPGSAVVPTEKPPAEDILTFSEPPAVPNTNAPVGPELIPKSALDK